MSPDSLVIISPRMTYNHSLRRSAAVSSEDQPQRVASTRVSLAPKRVSQCHMLRLVLGTGALRRRVSVLSARLGRGSSWFQPAARTTPARL